MIIDNEFELEDYVFLKTDIEQAARLVIEIAVKPNCLVYTVCLGTEVSCHYDFELSKERNIVMSTQN